MQARSSKFIFPLLAPCCTLDYDENTSAGTKLEALNFSPSPPPGDFLMKKKKDKKREERKLFFPYENKREGKVCHFSCLLVQINKVALDKIFLRLA